MPAIFKKTFKFSIFTVSIKRQEEPIAKDTVYCNAPTIGDSSAFV